MSINPFKKYVFLQQKIIVLVIKLFVNSANLALYASVISPYIHPSRCLCKQINILDQ